jgi:hypothetical protein
MVVDGAPTIKCICVKARILVRRRGGSFGILISLFVRIARLRAAADLIQASMLRGWGGRFGGGEAVGGTCRTSCQTFLSIFGSQSQQYQDNT